MGCVFVLGASATAAEPCRQALALGLDVSGSVDSLEYQLQLRGLAAALNHDSVRAAFLNMPDTPVRLAVYEWSGPTDHAIILPWTDITTETVLQSAISTLNAHTRTPLDPSTAIGEALLFGASLLNDTKCWVKTLDISGDGKSNTGRPPKPIAQELSRSITINALIIAPDPVNSNQRRVDIGELVAYFQANVISPKVGFTETAQGFKDYETAMKRKLLRELQTVVIGQLD